MVGVTSVRSAEMMLSALPAEAAATVVARAALRAIPALSLVRPFAEGGIRDAHVEYTLPTFRAAAAAWTAATFGIDETLAPAIEEAGLWAAGAGDVAGWPGDHPEPEQVVEAIRASACAAWASLASVNLPRSGRQGTPDADRARLRASRSVGALGASARACSGEGWAAISADAATLAAGRAPRDLADLTLWTNWEPPGELRQQWLRLEAALAAEDAGWEVWISWYRARLAGMPANEALERARVTLPDRVWRAGPAALNAAIARLSGT